MTNMTTISIPTEQLEAMRAIGQLILTQDNRCTDRPIFIVQEKVRVYGFDSSYSDDSVWIDMENDYIEATEEEAAKLEAGELEGGGWQKVYYKDEWVYVTACFTEQGCKDFIARDGHNHGELQIYAHISYRNDEFRAVRDFLVHLAQPPIDQNPRRPIREETRSRFVAKYGFEPEQAVRVSQVMEDGAVQWVIRRRSDEDAAKSSSMSASPGEHDKPDMPLIVL